MFSGILYGVSTLNNKGFKNEKDFNYNVMFDFKFELFWL
jgi:hypothetical protein